MRRLLWRGAGQAVALGALILLVGCTHLSKPRAGCDGDGEPPAGLVGAFVGPQVCGDPSMHCLAHDLDHLERHIDWFGSVVPKAPDVWGQARLTQYREEFEAVMEPDKDRFQETLQGSVSRQDQAFFLSATSIVAAVNSTQAVTTTPELQTAKDGKAGTTPPSQSVVQIGSSPPPLMGIVQTKDDKGNVTKTELNDVSGLFGDQNLKFKGDFKQSLLNKEGQKALQISLEPTEVLAQKKRYLDFLSQLRRENEGDDTADSPGYSLNLMRIPVSVLPGKKTDVGYAAEVTMTVTPILGEDLLPVTFRNLVVNDLIDHIGLPLTHFLDQQDVQAGAYLTEENRKKLREVKPGSSKHRDDLAIRMNAADRRVNERNTKPAKSLQTPTIPFSNGLLARQPFPTSLILDVYGVGNAFEIAYQAHKSFNDEIVTTGYVHLPNIQTYLREELNAAYQFLNAHPHLWEFCNPQLAETVKGRQSALLDGIRSRYREVIKGLVIADPSGWTGVEPGDVPLEFSKTAALAWCILVESALLTDRLQQDMRELATSKQVPLPLAGQWLPYYLPCPPPEARLAFNDYVRYRWPVKVFALDPYIQEQNLADRLSTRREIQLALSMAFVSGRVNFNQLNRFARRLEAEYETIDLNRTQVGFSHGESTFGWRFYPRYQTPDTPGNLTLFTRDLLIGGPNKNHLLRQRRLEPGMRECVAIVLMPSFVPYLHVDTVSNWFPITNPKHKVLDHTQAMRLSRTVQAIKTDGCGVRDADKYRPGERERLLRRAEQLEARLPTQTQAVQVPLMNTLGGFEMFNHGVADLAPELYGFYGAPGIDIDNDTALFLVGDHFSPLRTRVIAGNRMIAEKTSQQMLSRQVMRIVVPKNVLPVDYGDGGKYVRIHVATPYGVSTEVEVPVYKATPAPAAPAPAAGFSFDGAKLTAQYAPRSATEYALMGVGGLKLKWTPADQAALAAPKYKVQLEFKDLPTASGAKTTITLPCKCPVEAEFDKDSRTLTVPKLSAQAIAAELLQQLQAHKVPESQWASGLKTTKVTLTPDSPGPGRYPVVTADSLTVELVRIQYCGKEHEVPLKDGCPVEPPKAGAGVPPAPGQGVTRGGEHGHDGEVNRPARPEVLPPTPGTVPANPVAPLPVPRPVPMSPVPMSPVPPTIPGALAPVPQR